jgi:predicted MFS family arabinose efflux permease
MEEMDAGVLITVYLTSAFVAGLIAGVTAQHKRRHAGYWVVFCFLLPPLVLLLLILPKGHGSHYYGDPSSDSLD